MHQFHYFFLAVFVYPKTSEVAEENTDDIDACVPFFNDRPHQVTYPLDADPRLVLDRPRQESCALTVGLAHGPVWGPYGTQLGLMCLACVRAHIEQGSTCKLHTDIAGL